MESGRTLGIDPAQRLDEFFGAFAGCAAPWAPSDGSSSLGWRPHLLLDYDGTLAPFRVDRFQARPWTGVRELLAAIRRVTRVTVITGRPAGEIAPLLGLDPPLEVWGLHGAERLYPDGRRELEQADPEVQKRLDELRARLRIDSMGGLFEDKANGVVMHWRGVSRKQAMQIEECTRELFEPLARMDGLSLLEFEAGLELRVGRDKGGAVQAILAEAAIGASSSVPVAFLGDDVTDEAAFRTVRLLGRLGLTALVRREWRETAAELWLRPPEELKNFLGRWLEAAGGHGTNLSRPARSSPVNRLRS